MEQTLEEIARSAVVEVKEYFPVTFTRLKSYDSHIRHITSLESETLDADRLKCLRLISNILTTQPYLSFFIQDPESEIPVLFSGWEVAFVNKETTYIANGNNILSFVNLNTLCVCMSIDAFSKTHVHSLFDITRKFELEILG